MACGLGHGAAEQARRQNGKLFKHIFEKSRAPRIVEPDAERAWRGW
jgi:hypothetical protein